MKATGRAVAWSWLRMNEGFMEMVSKRNASEPSGACGPKASDGSWIALQQTATRTHERMSRSAFAV